ncbi:zincin-like metallopeptidase domain-containing protein [Caballeronia sp. LP003]|uniref:zincin-like metallopeptidase domain-containing protein n=1 Tax=Caballeronia sp. LP003 TaxID=3038551 RepID=UPI0028636F67|nr:zincin-like metallopeptidase domain-containing protein [Caballeronia sp. LP003]MDR5791709.1 zincin-like metallopeptidase domain-containing protein [Caballeronia sp. LP003]
MADLDEYFGRVTGQIAGQMARRQAPWVRSWTGEQLGSARPFNPASGPTSFYSGLNAVLLQSHLLMNGLDDPRFVTARQAQIKGWIPAGILSRGIDLHFVPRDDAASASEGRVYTVFHVSEFQNVPPHDSGRPEQIDGIVAAKAILAQSGIVISGDQMDRAFFSNADRAIHMPPRSSFADDKRYYALAMREAAHAFASDSPRGASDNLAPIQQQLRAELASLCVGSRLGLGHEPGSNREVVADWIKLLQSDRREFATAAQDAQRIADALIALSRQAQLTLNESAHPQTNPIANSPAQALRSGNMGAATSAQKPSRTFLAVPFKEIGEAKRLGARFDREQSIWWIAGDVDHRPFDRWLVTDATLAAAGVNAADVIAEFENVMRDFGLVVDKPVIDDGKWHYVPTELSKGSQKNGSYVLDMTGIPNGAVRNFKSGEGCTWRYDGARLTPEQRAAREAQAREQVALREMEIEQAFAEIAEACYSQFSNLPEGNGSHPYLERKGVQAHGVRIAKSDASDIGALLNLAEDSRERLARDTGSWLVIPGRDVDGKIWTLQAIHSGQNGPKLFTKNARKKGAFHLIGASDMEALSCAPMVAFAEGYATGSSVYEATGIPVVVAFDSPNLPDVFKAVAERLPSEQPKVICADNDQYFVDKLVERILTDLRLDSDGRYHSASVPVLADGDRQVRLVALNGLRADGEWHGSEHGKYRFSLETKNHARSGEEHVQPVVVAATAEIVDSSGKMVRLTMQNAGLNAAEKAAATHAAHIAVPLFADPQLNARPTDFNDLVKVGGQASVHRSMERAIGEAYRSIPRSSTFEQVAVRRPSMVR